MVPDCHPVVGWLFCYCHIGLAVRRTRQTTEGRWQLQSPRLVPEMMMLRTRRPTLTISIAVGFCVSVMHIVRIEHQSERNFVARSCG